MYKIEFLDYDNDFLIDNDYHTDDNKEMCLYIRFFTDFIHCPRELYRYDNGIFSMLQLNDLRKIISGYYKAEFLHFIADDKYIRLTEPNRANV